MANDLKKVGLIFKADGSTDFINSLKNVNGQLSENYQNFKLVQAQYDEHTKISQKLTDKLVYLNSAYDLQSNKVRVLQEEIKNMSEVENKDEAAIQKKKVALKQAEVSLANYENQIKKVSKELESGTTNLKDYAEKINNVGQKTIDIGKKASIVTGVVGGMGTAVVKVGSDFDSSMKQVAATMGITAEEIKKGDKSYKILEEAAQKCGESTKYSASEAAEALNYLALAGYDAKKSAETLPKVLNLAAAGNLDLATASDMVTDAMAALGLEVSDLDKYIDEMAKTSQKSNTDVAQLGEATLTVAGTAKMANMSLETMNAELGILANNGIKGAEGGTHLRNIILSLTSPTDAASKALKKLGINVLDSQGNVRDLNDIMADFNTKLDGMSDGKKTEVISTIFNKTDISAVNALIKGSGEEFDNLKDQLSNCSGSAKDMADTMNSSLEGQITLLKSQLEGVCIQLSKILIPIIKEIVKGISGLLTWLSSLDTNTQKIILIIIGLVAAIGPLLILIGKMATGVSSIIKLTTFLMANPVVLIIAGIVAIIAALIYLWNTNEEFRNAIMNCWNFIKDLFIKFNEFLTNIFQTDWTESFGFLGNIVNAFVANFSNWYNGIKQTLSGVIDFVKGVFTGDWSLAWEGIKNIFGGIFNSLLSIAKAPLNGIIALLNILIDGINFLIKGLNKIKIKTPDWIPGIGGKEFGFNLGNIGKIPYLANGGSLLNGAAIVAEAGPELLLQQGNRTRVVPLNKSAKNTELNNNENERPIFQPNITINSNSKYLSEAETARQTRMELQRLMLQWKRG